MYLKNNKVDIRLLSVDVNFQLIRLRTFVSGGNVDGVAPDFRRKRCSLHFALNCFSIILGIFTFIYLL